MLNIRYSCEQEHQRGLKMQDEDVVAYIEETNGLSLLIFEMGELKLYSFGEISFSPLHFSIRQALVSLFYPPNPLS